MFAKHWQASTEYAQQGLESAKEDIFASNLSSKLTKTFSTTLPSRNSPSNFSWFTTFINLLAYSLTNSAFCIQRSSKSLCKFNNFICLVQSNPWNFSHLSQASLAISQSVILVKIFYYLWATIGLFGTGVRSQPVKTNFEWSMPTIMSPFTRLIESLPFQ